MSTCCPQPNPRNDCLTSAKSRLALASFPPWGETISFLSDVRTTRARQALLDSLGPVSSGSRRYAKGQNGVGTFARQAAGAVPTVWPCARHDPGRRRQLPIAVRVAQWRAGISAAEDPVLSRAASWWHPDHAAHGQRARSERSTIPAPKRCLGVAELDVHARRRNFQRIVKKLAQCL